MIFVFGSNLAGIHGSGAARDARVMGMPMYLGAGMDERSGCYAIPTKNCAIQTLPIFVIGLYISQFVEFAERNPHMKFKVTRVGCGLAGLSDDEVAPLFADAPPNCYFDEAWRDYLPTGTRFWGTHAAPDVHQDGFRSAEG